MEGSEGFEACDDGNLIDDDGCLSSCVEARCGDGIYRRDLNPAAEFYEECDDGNDSDDDDCSTTCVSLGCGNGLVNEGEDCDDGNLEDADACHNDCTAATCGDGVLRRDLEEGEEGFEACDDANEDDGDDCTNGCVIATCGDGVLRMNIELGVEGYEACDDGNETDDDACLNACSIAVCGDGVLRAGLEEGAEGFEVCDDGNEADNDACRNSCIAAACGDSVIRMDIAQGAEGFEACDDGNESDSDACRNTCISAVCGDGIQRDDIAEGNDGYEACDDGNASNRDACVRACALAACGDGFVQRDAEVCDDGNIDDGDACDGDCQGPAPQFCEAPDGGGSEAHGYQWQADTCNIGPRYNWVDLARVNPAAGLTDDSLLGPFAIGFTFTFYGQQHTQVWVSSNGMVHFSGNAGAGYTSRALPAAQLTQPGIAAYWTDLNTGHIKVQGSGAQGQRQLVIERVGSEYGNNNNAIGYQVVLSEGSNEITINIAQAITTANHHNVTIGIQLQNAQNRALQAAYWVGGQVPQLREKAYRFVPW
jgi:cysteine-rich repeat protein